MLKNAKIKHLITASVSILLGMLLLMGGLSLYYMDAISSQTTVLYQRPHTNLVSMWQTKTEVLSVSNALKSAMLNKQPLAEDAKPYIEAVPALLNKIEGNKVDIKAATSKDMQKILDTAAAWNKSAKQLSDTLATNPEGVTLEAYAQYDKLAQSLVKDLDTIIATASTNALRFKDNSIALGDRAMLTLVILFIATLVLSLVILRFTLKSISRPMDIILQAAGEIASGKLDADIPYESTNEFGALASNFQEMKSYLKVIINDIDYQLYEMGQGNFNVQTQATYIGDFAPILTSLDKINVDLSHTMRNINQSAEEVTSGSEQVSSAAQALAQGATEQASSIEELSATINEMTLQIKSNAENANIASTKMAETGKQITLSNQQMQEMMTAMTEISNKSGAIEKIIKTIEDIAFQTNILALNAAVEAARAGSAGKGFAVVADEVRNLAGKSATAAKNTTELIEGTIHAVVNGTTIATETAQSLATVVDATKQVSDIVDEISIASNAQAESSGQVNLGIEQISAVVQTNSATAEESAAASAELFSQAETLKTLVDKFHLRQN